MSSFWNMLTTVVFAAHLMMGCCAHHAHACEGQGQVLPIHQTTAPGDPCPDSETEPSHHGPQGCQGGKCFFIGSANDAIAQSLVQHCRLSADLLLDDSSISSGSFRERLLFLTGRLLLPVRLHLANQVLLI